MLDRDTVIKRAIDECYAELYMNAQPKVDFKQLVEDAKAGKIDESETPVYNRYYLSHDEFKYITDKYIDAFGLRESWTSNIDLLKEYLEKGGSKDKYIKEYTDEHGNYHPGYRSYEDVPPIKESIKDIIAHSENHEYFSAEQIDNLANTITKKVLDNIDICQNFYRFDHEGSTFMYNIALGPSPTSNKQTVIDYWKKQGVNIKITDKNPLLLWEMDNYGDKFEEEMEIEYGENWKEIWDQRWKDKIAEDKKKEEDIQHRFNEMVEKTRATKKEEN